MLIRAASTISHQPTFQNKGFSQQIGPLNPGSSLLVPDYKTITSSKRKQNELVKLSITCALQCLKDAPATTVDGIIVGTSMGCCENTRSFMEAIATSRGKLISPTSFIFSPHNTIAGQISLHLQNNSYNVTHTQNTLSFEQALMDAVLCIEEGASNILVGAADEKESHLFNIEARLELPYVEEGSGVSFFIVSSETDSEPRIHISDVDSIHGDNVLRSSIDSFLLRNRCSADEIDLVMFSHSKTATVDILRSIFTPVKLFDFQQLCGTWFTNSAFAMSYGVDILSAGKHPPTGLTDIKRILICNNLLPANVGLILLDRES